MSAESSSASGLVVIGAGHGGANLVALLRQSGYADPIVMISDERSYPYHRPPLSKKFMNDTVCDLLRPEDFYAEIDVDLRLGTAAMAIDAEAHTVALEDGSAIPYDKLVIATGCRSRKLNIPGSELPGVLTLRNLDDAQQLKGSLQAGRKLVIVGGGYIGLEVAAEATAHGVAVTVVEREPRVLARVASPSFSERLSGYHLVHGTKIMTAADVVAFGGTDRVDSVLLADGTRLEADVVLVGAGVEVNDEIAARCGISCDGGILVDDSGRTSVADIYGLGDVTRRQVAGTHQRLESIPSATEQGKQIVADLMGRPPHPPEVAWFWSDQFDLKLKIAGHLHARDTVVERSESPEKFAYFHLDDASRLVAVETANFASAFMAGKKFIAQGSVLDREALADVVVKFKDCVN